MQVPLKCMCCNIIARFPLVHFSSFECLLAIFTPSTSHTQHSCCDNNDLCISFCTHPVTMRAFCTHAVTLKACINIWCRRGPRLASRHFHICSFWVGRLHHRLFVLHFRQPGHQNQAGAEAEGRHRGGAFRTQRTGKSLRKAKLEQRGNPDSAKQQSSSFASISLLPACSLRVHSVVNWVAAGMDAERDCSVPAIFAPGIKDLADSDRGDPRIAPSTGWLAFAAQNSISCSDALACRICSAPIFSSS